MHLLDCDGKRILLDCGIFQGHRKEAFERNRNLPFPPSSIDAVLLSHAHIDHSGNLPTLVRRGFAGSIFMTHPTVDLCEIMLRDSAHLQEKDVLYVNKQRIKQGKVPFEPLYTQADVDAAMSHAQPVRFGVPFEPVPGVSVTLYDAGHLLGSALTVIEYRGSNGRKRRLLFTGDLGRAGMPILRDPEQVTGIDVLITESTYGNRMHPPMADVVGRLKVFIEDITNQRSKLIIPSFSVGRTQEIVFFLNSLYREGRIPRVPVIVDSPLSSRATEVYAKHPECYDEETTDFMLRGNEPFEFRDLTYVTETVDSIKLNDRPGPMVIISSSGMYEGGRILHHLKHGLGDPRNIILFVGYQAENTLGRRLVEHESPVRILGDIYEVRARIHTINALSAHADRGELLEYFTRMGPAVEQAFVVHGEPEKSQALATALRDLGARNVVVPVPGHKASIE